MKLTGDVTADVATATSTHNLSLQSSANSVLKTQSPERLHSLIIIPIVQSISFLLVIAATILFLARKDKKDELDASF